MSKPVKTHTHEYKKRLVKIVADNPSYTGQAKGLIVAECKCGSEIAVDYGDFNKLSQSFNREGE